MPPTTIILIAIALITLTIVCILAGLWVLVGALNPEPTRSQARLKQVTQAQSAAIGDESFQNWLNTQTNKNQHNDDPLWNLLKPIDARLSISIRLKKAGVEMAPKQFILLFILAPVIFSAVLFSQQLIPVIAFIALLLVPILSLFWLGFKTKKRNTVLEQQLPDALNMLASSLRAGHSFASATQILSEQLTQPIQPVFDDIHNDLKLGVPMKESFAKMLNTVEVIDFKIFATAVLVQRESGGNLAEIVDKIGFTIRERAKLKRQISVLTAQPRLSAYIIGAAPIVMYILLQFIMPGYTQTLENHPLGPLIIGGAVGMQIAGFFVMRRIINIRI